MCGIGGVFCYNNEILDREDAENLKRLSIMLQKRGTDAYGFYNGEKVIKFPSSAKEVIEMLSKIKPFESFVEGKTMFLVHTRAATTGDPLRNKNNHPFELKDVVFAHNGVLLTRTKYRDILEEKINRNAKNKENIEYIDSMEILGYVETDLPETDSFEIGVEIQKMINKKHNFREAVEKSLENLVNYGDMALWIYSKRDNELALFNSGRELFIAREDTKIWFASEEFMLEQIGKENIEQVKEGDLIFIDEHGKEEKIVIIEALNKEYIYYYYIDENIEEDTRYYCNYDYDYDNRRKFRKSRRKWWRLL